MGGAVFTVPFGSRRVGPGWERPPPDCGLAKGAMSLPIWTTGSRPSLTRTVSLAPALLPMAAHTWAEAGSEWRRCPDEESGAGGRGRWAGGWHPSSMPTSCMASRTLPPALGFSFLPSPCSKDSMS